jgi:hypothetical protein
MKRLETKDDNFISGSMYIKWKNSNSENQFSIQSDSGGPPCACRLALFRLLFPFFCLSIQYNSIYFYTCINFQSWCAIGCINHSMLVVLITWTLCEKILFELYDNVGE